MQCPNCLREIPDGAFVCPYCTRVPSLRSHLLRGCATPLTGCSGCFTVALVITFVIACIYGMQYINRQEREEKRLMEKAAAERAVEIKRAQEEEARKPPPPPPPPHQPDDYDFFVHKYGPPDTRSPRLIDGRDQIWVYYEAERLKIVYVLDANGSWKQESFTDSLTSRKLTVQEVRKRMKGRLSSRSQAS